MVVCLAVGAGVVATFFRKIPQHVGPRKHSDYQNWASRNRVEKALVSVLALVKPTVRLCAAGLAATS